MTKEEFADKLRRHGAWLPGKRVKLDFASDGFVTIDGVAGRISEEDEPADTIVATPIHRFWKAGGGWTMARDLKPGDPIRTLSGVERVGSIEEEKVQPVFNLEVARGHSFFVGKVAALVHDNSLVETTTRPFDALPDLARIRPETPGRE